MTVANSVIDVILGEAKAGSYEDMLAIASVIENRSKQLGVSPEQVVQVQSEFNAYGKSIPPGNDQHRDLAAKALEQVRSQGPIHEATFYATPSASKNLPSGLEAVTATDGHNFYSDPQNRSIRTSSGFRAPQNSLLSFATSGPTPPSPAPRNGQEAIDAAMNVGSPLRGRTAEVEERNSQELAFLPSLDQTFNYPLQNQPQRVARGFAYGPENYDINQMNPEAARSARRAFDNLGVNPRINSSFRSGAVPKGARQSYNTAVDGAQASQHRLGNALDVSTRGMSNQQKAELVDSLMAEGLGGIGVGPNIVHADTGRPRSWTYGNAMPSEVQDVLSARYEGGRLNRYPSDFGRIGAPSEKPDVSGLPVIAGTMPQSQPASLSAPSAVRETVPNPAGMSIGGVSGQGVLPVAPTYVSAVRPTSVQPVSSRPVNPAQPSRQTTVDAYQQFAQSRAAPAQQPSVPVAAYVSPSNLPQVTPDAQPLPDVAISAPIIEAPKQQDLPKIDAPVVSGVGVPKSKPSAPKKQKQISKQLGQIAGGVLGGMIAGPFGAIPGALIGRQFGKAGLPQMGPLSLGPLVSAEGFGRTATGQAVNAATRGGGFDNAAYTRAYAAAGGSDDPKSYSRALAEEQRQRSRSGQKTVGDAFGGWF